MLEVVESLEQDLKLLAYQRSECQLGNLNSYVFGHLFFTSYLLEVIACTSATLKVMSHILLR